MARTALPTSPAPGLAPEVERLVYRRRPRLSRRAFASVLLGAACGLVLTGDVPSAAARTLPVAIDNPDLARYLQALGDLPTPAWSLLAVTASVMDPGTNVVRNLSGRLPSGTMRGTINGWAFRAEGNRMRAILASAQWVYAAVLPPARATYYNDQLERERYKLAIGGQVDYRGLSFLMTLVNREWGIMDRLELEQLDLVRRHALDPVAYPRDVAALLAERDARRDLAVAFRREAERLLQGAVLRLFDTPAGPITLLADLGRPAGPAPSYQLIRARLVDSGDTTIAAHAVYFTASEFLALEPPAPSDSWADALPPEQRAFAAANTLSPRLDRASIVAPGHASRVQWPSLQDCETLVAQLRRL